MLAFIYYHDYYDCDDYHVNKEVKGFKRHFIILLVNLMDITQRLLNELHIINSI